MSDISQEFEYNISKVQLLLMVAISTALPFLMAWMAEDNQKGLRLFHIITFSQNDATSFYRGMAMLCGIAALFVIFTVFSSLRHPKQVELHATHANLPKASMFGGQLNIPYNLITNISRRTISATQEMVVIKSTVGESRLIASQFKGLLGYQDFLSALSAKISLTHPSSGSPNDVT